ncbi:hypothetical protein [Lentimicrobium sp. S6]|nr:hypothetical protein [Lentimicrobium sp. S6]
MIMQKIEIFQNKNYVCGLKQDGYWAASLRGNPDEGNNESVC